MYKFLLTAALSLALLSCGSNTSRDIQNSSNTLSVVVAYVSGGQNKPLPDFDKVTHIDYAFGWIDSTFAKVEIENPERFEHIAELKNEYNRLSGRKVFMQLSIGGWGSGRFSEMVADSILRHSFVASCKAIVKEYGIDGIDLDWEYPSSGVAGISSAPEDVANFTLLVKELREALGKDKLLTIATISTARFIDFKAVDPYIDFYNIMSYDMAVAPFHHSPLKRFEANLLRDTFIENLKSGDGLMDYPSDTAVAQQYGLMYKTPVVLSREYFRQYIAKQGGGQVPEESAIAGQCTTEEAVMMHIIAGLDVSKLVLGMPFYGKSGGGVQYPFQQQFEQKGETGEEYSLVWDEIAQVPYVADASGALVFGFENQQSIRAKCRFAKEHKLLGVMYWEYCIDAGRPEADTLKPNMLSRNSLIDAVAEEILNH